MNYLSRICYQSGSLVGAGAFFALCLNSSTPVSAAEQYLEAVHLPYCENSSNPILNADGFNYWSSQILSTTLYPHHFASDVLAVNGYDAVVEGKFSYGPLGNDLAAEWVELWLDNCEGSTVQKGRLLTDNSGRARWTIPGNDLPAAGYYRVYMRVVGDNSSAEASLQVLAPQSRVAVFDLDSTLTVSDLEPLKDFFCYDNNNCSRQLLRPGAKETTLAREKEGLHMLYLVGRHYTFTNWTKQWLGHQKFAAGAVILPQSITEVIPYESYVGEFKLQTLRALKNKGLSIECAYGNALSDIYAYKAAGIPDEAIFIVGQNGGAQGTRALGDDFESHVDVLNRELSNNS